MPRGGRVPRHLRETGDVGFFGKIFRFIGWLMWSRAMISRLATVFVGVGYPGYQSFKAIKSADKEQQEKWLTYWIVFSVLTIVETLCWPLLRFLPFYFEIKLVALICLMHPKINGASRLYVKILKPNLEVHEKTVDGLVAKADAAAGPHLNLAADKVNEQLDKAIPSDVKKVD